MHIQSLLMFLGITYLTPLEVTEHAVFERWWREDGRFHDFDTVDVPLCDQSKKLAEIAYEAGKQAGLVVGRNYETDDFAHPKEVKFDNGCRITLRVDHEGRNFLSVGRW